MLCLDFGNSVKIKSYYVFLVPVSKELDLKKAAKAVGEKKIEMLKSKELLPLKDTFMEDAHRLE